MASRIISQWYARRNGTVRGPFTEEYVARYILLGRIRLADELSQDRFRWRPVREYPELFPEELQQLSSWEDYQRLVMARMNVDERISQRREGHGEAPLPFPKERRRSAERRRIDCDAEFFRYHLMDDALRDRQGRDKSLHQLLRRFLLAALLVTLVFAYFSISAR
jgi:hypothetical protein